MERYRVEHRMGQYLYGPILLDWDIVMSKEMHSSDFGDIIELVDKRLYSQWADGISIFYLTVRQLSKLKTIISKTEFVKKLYSPDPEIC